jgi:hypothetical protein
LTFTHEEPIARFRLSSHLVVKVNSAVVPVHAMKSCGRMMMVYGSTLTQQRYDMKKNLHLHLHSPTASPSEKNVRDAHQIGGWKRGRFGVEIKLLPPPGIKPRFLDV